MNLGNLRIQGWTYGGPVLRAPEPEPMPLPEALADALEFIAAMKRWGSKPVRVELGAELYELAYQRFGWGKMEDLVYAWRGDLPRDGVVLVEGVTNG